MPNSELIDEVANQGFNKGYHQAIEDMVATLRVKILEPGRSLGTRNVLEVLISDARVLDLSNARKNYKVGE